MPENDIKKFIDFFHDAVIKIRNQKAVFVRGKDGNLVKSALDVFSRSQLEMLAIWFLAKKDKLSPTIGAMLSRVVLEELQRKMKESGFWKDLDEVYERYYQSPKEREFTVGELDALRDKLRM